MTTDITKIIGSKRNEGCIREESASDTYRKLQKTIQKAKRQNP